MKYWDFVFHIRKSVPKCEIYRILHFIFENFYSNFLGEIQRISYLKQDRFSYVKQKIPLFLVGKLMSNCSNVTYQGFHTSWRKINRDFQMRKVKNSTFHIRKSMTMYIITWEIDRQARFNEWDRVLRAGAWGWPWGHGEGSRRAVQGMGKGREVRGRFRMGNTCTPVADSRQCMAKTTTIL